MAATSLWRVRGRAAAAPAVRTRAPAALRGSQAVERASPAGTAPEGGGTLVAAAGVAALVAVTLRLASAARARAVARRRASLRGPTGGGVAAAPSGRGRGRPRRHRALNTVDIKPPSEAAREAARARRAQHESGSRDGAAILDARLSSPKDHPWATTEADDADADGGVTRDLGSGGVDAS